MGLWEEKPESQRLKGENFYAGESSSRFTESSLRGNPLEPYLTHYTVKTLHYPYAASPAVLGAGQTAACPTVSSCGAVRSTCPLQWAQRAASPAVSSHGAVLPACPLQWMRRTKRLAVLVHRVAQPTCPLQCACTAMRPAVWAHGELLLAPSPLPAHQRTRPPNESP
ncbi:hypothetical protein Patl1_07712 [Pistacia atlantica]|uniref:Uncharacterized protein n=1 Tax=Pistacia atlantica TaxID=434234 RepID=A0ACC1AHA2_9ROSI|nr:hypothetical protein Patl1_07712 [Pistacia atlantica]